MLVTPQSIGVYAGIETVIRGIMSPLQGWQQPMPEVGTYALPRSCSLVIAGHGGGLFFDARPAPATAATAAVPAASVHALRVRRAANPANHCTSVRCHNAALELLMRVRKSLPSGAPSQVSFFPPRM